MTSRDQITFPENEKKSEYDDKSDLMVAIKFSKLGKNFDIAKELLEKYDDINKIDDEGKTLLIKTLFSSNEHLNKDIIKLIIEKGSHVSKLVNPFISLSDKIEKETTYPISLLTKIKETINKYTDFLPLTISIDRNDFETAKLLLEKGANVNELNRHGDTLLIKSVFNSDRIEFTKLALEYKADTNITDNIEKSALYYAVDFRKTEHIKLLLDAGANINSTKNSPFKKAIERSLESKDYSTILKMFFEKGAKVDMLENNGIKSLKDALFLKNFDVYNLLIDNGVDFNKEDNGISALMYAFSKSNYDDLLNVIKCMLEKNGKQSGIDKELALKITDKNNKELIKILKVNQNSLLLKAIKAKNINMITLLLKEKINIDENFIEIIKLNDLEVLKLCCENIKTELKCYDILDKLVNDKINSDILDYIYKKF